MKRFYLGLIVLFCVVAAPHLAEVEAFRGTLGRSSLILKGDWQFHTGGDMR